MARPLAQGDDTALNMTPMIDVCFQLIVFFMLTLKFKSVDRRFETQLPNIGQQATASVLPIFHDVEVRLFREGTSGPLEEQHTKIRVGEGFTRVLPRGPWPKDADAAAARAHEEERIRGEVSAAIASVWAQQGRGPEVKAAILTPYPKGACVPHGDVMLVFDAFVDAGMTEVHLEGAAAPLPSAAGGGWGFDR